MTRPEILTAVLEALEVALEEPVHVGPETNLIEDGVLDSLDGMRFLFELEKRVGVRFPEEDLPDGHYFVVGNVIEFILEAKRPEASGA